MSDRIETRRSEARRQPAPVHAARAVALLALVWLGCGDEPDPGSLILSARVIGGVTQVEGAPERAVPASGEAFSVRWIVAQPTRGPESFTWQLAACVARPSPVGRPFCVEPPFFLAEGARSVEAPAARIEVPAGLGEDAEVLLLGVLCREGVPDTSAVNPRELSAFTVCTEGVGQIVAQSLRVASAAENLRPLWPENAARWAGGEWPGPEECVVVPKEGVELAFVGLEGVTRDTFGVPTEDVPPQIVELREALIVSHHATAGELERQFGVLDDDEAPSPFTWKPAELTERTTVRFYFGLRDQRGGADFLVREVCVDPTTTTGDAV